MSNEFINLSGGDPDAEAPRWAVEATVDAIEKGGAWTHYAAMTNHPEPFKQAVVDYYKGFTGVGYDPGNVISTAGSSAALYMRWRAVWR